jgi:hypothetical protein
MFTNASVQLQLSTCFQSDISIPLRLLDRPSRLTMIDPTYFLRSALLNVQGRSSVFLVVRLHLLLIQVAVDDGLDLAEFYKIARYTCEPGS